MSKGPLSMAFVYYPATLLIYMDLAMQTGHDVPSLDGLQLDFVCSLVEIAYLGVLRSNQQYLALALKRSIGLLHLLQLSSHGSRIFYEILVFTSLNPQFYFVIMCRHFTWPSIQSFMQGQNILRWIIILLEKRWPLDLLLLDLSLLAIKLPMYSLNLYLGNHLRYFAPNWVFSPHHSPVWRRGIKNTKSIKSQRINSCD